LNIDGLRSRITGLIGREIFYFDTVDSTNTTASEIAAKTLEGAVVLADSQGRGRGRLGRAWVSPPGVNLYMSIILMPDIRSRDATLITIMSSVACATALRRASGLDILIKWPNDLTVKRRKLGGILTDLKTEENKISLAVLGIGINVNADVERFPEDVKSIATSLKHESGSDYSRTEIAAEVLNELDVWYKILKTMDRDTLLSAWKQLSSTLGREVSAVTSRGVFRGLARDIDGEGLLIMELPTGEIMKISSGDVTLI